MSPPKPSPPRPTPTVPTLGDNPSPSGSWKTPTVHEVLAIADVVSEEAVKRVTGQAAKTEKSTRLQWVGLSILGAFTVGSGVFMAWCLAVVLGLGTAQAQTKATADAALKGGEANAVQIQTVDAGARAAVERLERKIDDNDAKHDRQNEAMNAKLDKIADAVRAKH